MDDNFGKFRKFACVYIDDILIHSKSKEEHITHLKLVLSEFLKQEIVLSSKTAQFSRNNIESLGVEIRNGTVKLQPRILRTILEAPLIRDIKTLQQLLGFVNYTIHFIRNLEKLAGFVK